MPTKISNNRQKFSNLIALEYLPEFDSQPLITIKTESEKETALVLSLAKKYKIPIVEDSNLTKQLSECDEGADLPCKLFNAIATIFNEIDKILKYPR